MVRTLWSLENSLFEAPKQTEALVIDLSNLKVNHYHSG